MLWATVHIYTTYTTIIPIIYLFALFTCTTLLGGSLQRRSSNRDCCFHTQLHTRLTELLLPLIACFVVPFDMRKWSVLWRFLKCNVQGFTFSRILLRLHCCLFIVYTMLVIVFAYLSIHFSLTIVVVGLLGTSSIFNCVAFVYPLMLHYFYFRNNNAYRVIVFIFDNYELYS